MIDHPRFTRTDGDEPALEVTTEPSGGYNFSEPTRETYVLSTRAIGLVVDELDYSEREEVAPVTTKILFLTGGAYVPDETLDVVETVQRLRFPDGGKHPTDAEVERVAAHLKRAEIEQGARWIVEKLVENGRLADVMGVDEIRTQRERMNGLRGIAKDL
ncbi:MAG: hypothetical protein ACQET5_08950 [Halobacteriota archaeon]|uniref:hypothetical protein n=1 Tax=Natronomonas sp. TaxID=2184060 RepID=UPI00397550C9